MPKALVVAQRKAAPDTCELTSRFANCGENDSGGLHQIQGVSR
jgi:hypothetical protein